MTLQHILGIAGVLALIIGVGLYSGRKVSGTKDFTTGGGKVGSLLVCGSIMGALVGSQATIGTAQLAFHYGLSAWWFTLGSGIGCLLLALFYTKPLRESGCITELSIIAKEYGGRAGELGSALCSIGIFISVLAQFVACGGLISVLFPSVGILPAMVISVLLMAVYVIFGGAWGAGMGGFVKLLLLCLACFSGLIFIYIWSGGFTALFNHIESLFMTTTIGSAQSLIGLSAIAGHEDFSSRFLSLVARGPVKDIGSGISLLLGVLATQTYAQAILSGKSHDAARKGALISAVIIPPLGIAGVMIGLYMRAHYMLASEAAALTAAGLPLPDMPILDSTIQAFPAFAINHLPPVFAGVIIGTLFISVIGGGAGLTLGVATIITNDILLKIFPAKTDDNEEAKAANAAKTLRLIRTTIMAVLITAGVIGAFVPGAIINDFGFLSMGLRGAVVFVPLSLALFMPGKIAPKSILLSIILSPLAVLAANFCGLPGDPLFYGMGISCLWAVIGKVNK
ncbi:MAG: hypothetical protein IIV92_03025 [Schwartzia sp.]|nr:hypothetical protein [Schwartzia sp. (in: firmicutes)]